METILFINPSDRLPKCGVYQYGLRCFNALKPSTKYNFVYCDPFNIQEFLNLKEQYNPIGVFVNYNPPNIYGWIQPWMFRTLRLLSLGIIHEEVPREELVDIAICLNSAYETTDLRIRKVARCLPEHKSTIEFKGKLPTFTTFGFGYKPYIHILKAIENEYDEAVLRIHLPDHDYSNGNGPQRVQEVIQAKTKPGIVIEGSYEFFDQPELIDHLSKTDALIFLHEYRGTPMSTSSAIDFALAAQRPVIINHSNLFNHVNQVVTQSICIEDSSIKHILSLGLEPLKPLYEAWSSDKFRMDIEKILDEELS